jgi:two-component system chemotaxis sensor kinase CheA
MTSAGDLRAIFLEEVQQQLNAFNETLMALEMLTDTSAPDFVQERAAHLKDAQRIAHTIKGAARSVGAMTIETVGHYLEAILTQLHDKQRIPDAELADRLYDGADLIARLLPQHAPNAANPRETAELITTELQADVIAQLEQALLRVANLSADVPDGTSADMLDGVGEHTPDDTDDLPPTIDTGKMKLLDLFQIEAEEYLGIMNEGLLKVEMETGDERRALLRDMNRVAHSLKGAARAVGWGLVETIAHQMEEIFGSWLQKPQDADIIQPEEADTLYDGLDIIQQMLAGNSIDSHVQTQVLRALNAIMDSHSDEQQNAQTADQTTTQQITRQKDDSREMLALPVSDASGDDVPLDIADVSDPQATTPVSVPTTDTRAMTVTRQQLNDLPPTVLMRPAEETIRVAVGKLDALMAQTSEMLVTRQQSEARNTRMRALQDELGRWQREWRSVRAAYIRLARRMQETTHTRLDSQAQQVQIQEQNAVRDDIGGELATIFKFLESNQRYLTTLQREITHLTQDVKQETLLMGALVDQLQNDVSALRMMPFATITGGFQRLVRDLARDTGKQVQLFIDGASVEIDKTVLDALKDPLLHLLRNSIDHGIEAPEDRRRLQKAPLATVRLDVEQRGSEIMIRVQDDGKGIDVALIRRRAIARGHVSTSEAETLSDDDWRTMIFESGFSTSEEVTALSGRGLGMDIVRERVESLRGRISLDTVVGQGTTISINVPVSLTRIRAILLHLGTETYALPAVMVTRMAQVERDAIFTAEGQPAILLNDRPVALVDMGTLLGVKERRAHPDFAHIVALSAVDRTVAFEVDALSSEIELVLKPLGKELAHAPLIAGAALMGSGDVVVVLDGNDLVRQALGANQPARRQRLFAESEHGETAQRATRVLVVDDSITTRTLEKNILEGVGFDVSVAMDGAEAWALLPEVDPDVVISDVEMPKVDGLALTRLIKQHADTAHLPVILLTSLAKPEQREAGLQAGADAYLVKSSFDQGELLATIAAVLGG